MNGAEDLEDRVRAALASVAARPTERRMFSGLAFLVEGRMAVAVSAAGVMVRLSEDDAATSIASGEAEQVEMRGRAMRGWVRMTVERADDERALTTWVERGVADARGRD